MHLSIMNCLGALVRCGRDAYRRGLLMFCHMYESVLALKAGHGDFEEQGTCHIHAPAIPRVLTPFACRTDRSASA